ncbi:FliH/SctL family protein [Aneurinibacillus aneurinilyticus]|nr:FliH/SctL family protein [Aneurinibacillus aneurinilyticus]MED0707435.1 FliH/SctL family protein [Aneurinibacillus aneurinilyticus]MED0724757.1 FliH/SctL family protein [Aneurinibacillus aneurinilyticus]MED0733207.1 FliH/SctL family protein [Aneurinibacillus aneurinilyticus]MED0742816.1 FliH/SctL family protein [Aneurinibacillus aneurinilyticus]
MSRIIKSASYSTMENKKVIEFQHQKDTRLMEKSEEQMGAEEVGKVADESSSISKADEIIKNAEEEAGRIVAEARRQAEAVIQEARQEVDAWWNQKRVEDEEARNFARQEGYAQGMEQGREEGREEGRRLVYEEYAQALEQAAAILEEAPSIKRRMIAEAEPFVLDLTIEIARKVIGEQLMLDKENVIALIRKALSRTQEYKSVTVAVSPDTYTYVQENRAKLLEVLDSQVEITIIPDDAVTDGGAVIRTTMGSVDARVDVQLEEIKKALQAVLANEGEL